MTTISIIHIYDAVNASSYTFDSYFTDQSTAITTIHNMANYWVQEHGGQYLGFVESEDGFVVKKDQDIVMIYSVQSLTDFVLDNVADSI